MRLLSSAIDKFRETSPQIVAAISVTIVAISDGMQYGWTSPTIPILLSPDSPLMVTIEETEWLEYVYMIGAGCGLPITMYLVDKLGRKQPLIIAVITSALAWAVMAVAPKVEYTFAARLFSGMAGDMVFVAGPMYIAEIADHSIRGFLSSLINVMLLIGILIMYCVGPLVAMWAMCVLGVVINFAGLIILIPQPESPYYLLYKNKPEEAQTSLRKLRKNKDIAEEFKEISIAIEIQSNERGRFLDLFLVPNNRKALIIMLVLNVAQNMSGISVILMNLEYILEEANSYYVSAYTGSIIFSSMMFISALSASLVIDKFGRRFLLCCSGITAGISLLTIAAYFTLKNSGMDTKSISWLPLLMLLIYVTSFKYGMGLVPVVMVAELFSAKVKVFGMTLAECSYVGFSVVSLMIYHPLMHAFGIQVPFYIFACTCFCTVIFTICYIPETKGRTLEEIQVILK